ncbi:glyoxylate reductase/hydroxypyruvate reductase-like [Tribolium castaneum]|uniref:Glyoxylate reductase/hydroxypyruvate reductase n=1 Tax=Tribolium castaneum TaxID=7070 RepID=D6WXF3_TRICA|nr:glyoxylate reductase/hydroxypyruvate reductase-like [Tribolium castaneum]EFA08834.1 LOW QUALITY PROTEIN: C-terminal-binding protein-like Protein [Tribolium castaneum]|eukprot:NP_001153726.1 glyoxylate reductase/hydroxypyruvate reductase-like [Tribolium castaneum]
MDPFLKPPKILITNPTVPQIALDILGRNCELIHTKDDKRESILEKVSGVDAILWATKVNLDVEILDKAGPQMKTVGAMSAGVNNIDVPELKKRGIRLGNTPEILDDAVADVAVLLALGAARRLHEGRLKIEKNQWTPGLTWMLGQDVRGSTVGIVGLGGIGQAVVKRMKGFSVSKFLYTGHREKSEGKELGCHFVSLETLVKDSDFVVVSCPLTPETRQMFNDSIFDKMKKTAVFVNVSRGEVVDQDALIRALKAGKIFAAGLDVMTPEPLPADHELVKLPNVVLLPHLGSATEFTRNGMAEVTAHNILRGIAGEEMFAEVC